MLEAPLGHLLVALHYYQSINSKLIACNLNLELGDKKSTIN